MNDRKEIYQSSQQRKATKRFRMFAVVVAGICLFIGFVCFWFYGQVQATIREESNGYLKEISTRVGSNIQKIIGDTYAMLGSFVNTIDRSGADSFDEFRAIAAGDQEQWGYEAVYLIDRNGNAYDVNGKNFALTGDVYLRDVVLHSEESMSPLQLINGEECAIFAVPLEDRVFDGTPMAALAVTYNTDTFAKVLSMSSFDKQAYSHIVSKDGTMIVRSDAEVAIKFGFNVFEAINDECLLVPATADEYRKNVQSDQTGQVEFQLNGRREYMVYSPIPPDDWYLLTFVPTDVVNAKSNLLLITTLLISGFITVVFTILMMTMLISFRKYQRRLEHIAYIDDVTGGNTIERFYELVEEALKMQGHPVYALIYTNISKFKVFNESFSRAEGDNILRCFYETVNLQLKESECMGRLMADNFCILTEYNSTIDLGQRFQQWYKSAAERIESQKVSWSLPIMEFGIYVIESDVMPLTQMIDRAKLALHGIPQSINPKVRYTVYNDQVRAQLVREKQLEDMMEEALRRSEFKMYLQPKFRTQDEAVVGAEALTRWVSQSEGMIFPDEFIPLFEKNGFILQLDLWIFEEACRFIRSLMDEGKAPVKISVNCSRVHLRETGLVHTYRRIATQYNVPTELLEIELTESLVLEDSELFRVVVEELHNAGFGCSMDDFGSGYSSLNMIQDLTVDTIKLDKIFFRNEGRDPVRTESVVGNIVSMAKALSMETVGEGVERAEQVAMLRRVGCDLIQGYVFAKPMPVDEFREMLLKKDRK